MSFDASTDEGVAAPGGDSVNGRIPPKRDSAEVDTLQPWQLFILAGLIGATIAVFFSRGQTPAAMVLLTAAILAAAFVGLTALETLLPLTRSVPEDRSNMLGGRTRAALERDKALVLRTIKELEFDRGMGKVSEKDFAEMSARLRARAGRIMRQLDAGSLYREQIEKEVGQRLFAVAPRRPTHAVCTACRTTNEHDARFCKNCGNRLGA